jgi:glycosyltransferase involved in cell wall biosynthesis
MNAPKISVLIPTYNYAHYLPEAIESALAQDWTDFELIVSDDASQDNSREVVADYAARDRRIRFHAQPANLGMVQNWNWCLSQARGEYIKFLFGDDKFASRETLRKLMDMLEANPSAVLSASARLLISDKSEPLEIADEFGQWGLRPGVGVMYRCMHYHANLIGEPSAVMFRKRDCQRGFDASYRQLVDLEMWFALLESGDLVYTPEVLCSFRKHQQQQTHFNSMDGTLPDEAARLLWAYHEKPYLQSLDVNKLLFRQVYVLRKKRRPINQAMEAVMMAELGKLAYAEYWVRHKISRPWENLQHSVRKRWFR